MYLFGEKLAEAVERYGVKAADVCRKIGLNKAYFSKMKSGTLLPANCDIVRDMAEAMNVSEEDRRELCELYCRSKLGEEYWNIRCSLKEIYEVTERNSVEKIGTVTYENGQLIEGLDNICKAVRGILENSRSEADVLLFTDNRELCGAVADSLCGKTENFRCRLMVYVEADNEVSEYNVSLFSRLVPIMMRSKVGIHYDCADVTALREFTLFPYVFAGENEAVFVSGDCTSAVYLNTRETVGKYAELIREKYDSSKNLCLMFDNISDFISGNEEILFDNDEAEPSEVYVLKRFPCIMLEVNSDVVSDHFRDESIKSEFVAKFMEFLHRQNVVGINRQNIMFSPEGITELLEASVYYEYNESIDYPVSKELRRKFFGKALDIANLSEAIQINAIEDFFPENSRHCMNIWSNGKLLIFFNFEDRYRILILNEKGIVFPILRTLEEFRNIRYIHSKKRTLEIMAEKSAD